MSQADACDRRIACGSKESERPLSRFPLRGKAGAGGFPPHRRHAACQQRALARIVRRLPPQEGCRPLVNPLRALWCTRLRYQNHPTFEAIDVRPSGDQFWR